MSQDAVLTTEPVADSVGEFCASAGIGRTRFYKEVKEGHIKIVKFGRRTLVPRTERARRLSAFAGEAA